MELEVEAQDRGRLWREEFRASGSAQRLRLGIPKLRKGSYFPDFLESRSTAGKALTAVVRVPADHDRYFQRSRSVEMGGAHC